MKSLRLLLPVVAMNIAIVGSGWAQAVSVDATSLMKRLDNMESRLNAMDGRRAPVAAGGGAGYSAADLEQRTTLLEEQQSRLQGSIDRNNHAVELLAKRFDDYIKDMDMRLSDMETRMNEISKKEAAAPIAPAAVAVTDATVAATPAAPATAPAAPAATAGVPKDLSAEDHYNKAYAYLTATDYKNAEVWFKEFLKRHPQDKLADNAYYWLGEVYLVQNKPADAAGAFRDGLKANPKSAKAPADLLKMGVALQQLKKPDLAKAAWMKLQHDYPKSPEAARAKDKILELKE